jgi:predicted component of type VI protein secretion system
MPKLIFTDASGNDRTVEIVLERTTVGRASRNTLCIPDSSLSREHCEILAYGPEVIVRDLGSRNGTFVDGRRLTEEQCQLKHGHMVTFGAVQARLEIEAPSPDEPPSSAAFERIARVTEPIQPATAAAERAPPAASSSSQEQTIMLQRSPTLAAVPNTVSPEVPRARPAAPKKVVVLFLALVLLLAILILLF